MKIPANWRKPDWKAWGKAVWQRTRVYAVVLTVAAVGIGLYGAFLMHQLPKWQAETMTAAAAVQPNVQPTAERQPKAQPAPTELTASHVAPVRVTLPSDSQPAAEAETTEAPKAADEQTEASAPAAAQLPSAETEISPQAAEAAPILEQAPRWVYVDPAKLTAAAEPCHGASLSRGYGFTYDERYGDYRYHSGVTYTVGRDRSVLAVRAGKVLSIDHDAQEIIIGDEDWQVTYQPIDGFTVSVGQTVTSGRALGNVPPDSETFSLSVQQKQ